MRQTYWKSTSIAIALSGLVQLRAGADNPAAGAAASPPEKNQANVEVKPVTPTEKQRNEETAQAANKVSGVDLQGKDLQPPAPEEPIHGFHPIKKMLQPIVRLEKNSVQLEQQIMKLEGPIAGLQPAMLDLHKKMGTVGNKISSMQSHIDNVGDRIDGVGSRVNDVDTQMGKISGQMTAVRTDITNVSKQINKLEGPIRDLHKPLSEVAQPLSTVDQKLEKLAALLTTVLFAILMAAGIIAIGTPIAAVLIYRNRRKLFPDMSDRDFPVAKATDNRPTMHASKT